MNPNYKIEDDYAYKDYYTVSKPIVEIDHPASVNTVEFHAGGETILSINEKGLIYKGVLVEDAGAAHKAWLEVMEIMRTL